MDRRICTILPQPTFAITGRLRSPVRGAVGTFGPPPSLPFRDGCAPGSPGPLIRLLPG
jgi:hypothetical protein